MTNDQSLLLTHLENLNRKSEAWVAEDPKNRWSSTYITDLNYWAKEGIFSVEDHTHHSLVCNVFEATRSAFGYKPSWSSLMSMSDSDLRKEMEFLDNHLKAEVEFERNEEMAHNKAVEKALTTHHGFSIGEMIMV